MANLKAGVQDLPATGGADKGDGNADDLELGAVAAGDAGQGDQGDAGDGGEGGASDADLEEASVARVSEFMRKKGITDPAKLIDLAEDLERRNTRLDQDVRRLSASGRPLAGYGPVQPQGQMGRQVAEEDFDVEVPENPLILATDPKALKEWGKKLLMTGLSIGEKRQARANEERTFEDHKAKVQAHMEANPEEFEILRPRMLDLSRAYPRADVDQLYDEAKRLRNLEIKAHADALRKELGLEGSDKAKLKGIFGRVRQAPISSGTGTQVAGLTQGEKKDHADMLKAIMDSDKN